MKAFVVVLAVVAAAYAKPQYLVLNNGLSSLQLGSAGLVQSWNGLGGLTYSASPVLSSQVIAAPQAITYAAAPSFVVPAVTKTQYHAQDEFGQASYGYAHPGQAHAAVRDAAGNVRGSYAYIGADAKEVRVNYVADAGGFRVESNALPVAPAVPVTPLLVGPAPVVDTPEVAEAKAAHAKAIAEAEARNAEADKAEKAAEAPKAEETQSRRKRSLLVSSPLIQSSVLSAPALTYSTSQVVAAPAYTYAAAPAYTYAAAPAYTYAAAPALTYAAAPAIHTYAAPAVVAANPLREATLTKVVNTPGHAVSYRVD